MTGTKSEELSVIEAALLVSRRTETIYRAISNQRIKATQRNGEWIVNRESLLRYIKSPRAKAAKARAEREDHVRTE